MTHYWVVMTAPDDRPDVDGIVDEPQLHSFLEDGYELRSGMPASRASAEEAISSQV